MACVCQRVLMFSCSLLVRKASDGDESGASTLIDLLGLPMLQFEERRSSTGRVYCIYLLCLNFQRINTGVFGSTPTMD